jgi:hypothetical protein
MDVRTVDIEVKKWMVVLLVVLLFVFLWRLQMNTDIDAVGKWNRMNKNITGATYDLANNISAFYIFRIVCKILLWILVFKIMYNILFNILVSNFVSFLKVSKDAKKDMNLDFVFKDVLTLKVIFFLMGCAFVSGLLTRTYVRYMVLPEHMGNVGRLNGHIRSIYFLSIISFVICLAVCFWLTRLKK